MSKVWLVSDTHFGHMSLLKKFRGFNSVKDHDEWLIESWNRVVKKRDVVIHLGDVAMNHNILPGILPRLNGTKHLIMGNHDKGHVDFYRQFFAKIDACRRYKNYWLTHFPVHPQELQFRVSVNIHGHIHDYKRNLDPNHYFNVNIDSLVAEHGQELILFEDVDKIIKRNKKCLLSMPE